MRPLVGNGGGGGGGGQLPPTTRPPTTTQPPTTTRPPPDQQGGGGGVGDNGGSGDEPSSYTPPGASGGSDSGGRGSSGKTGTGGDTWTTRIVDAPPVDDIYTPASPPPSTPPATPPATPPPPSTPPATPPPPASLAADLEAVLKRHNERRAAHGAAPLQWDAALAAQAQGYADGCPGGHSQISGVGENLAWGHASFTAAADAWYDEVGAYDFNNPTFSSGTGHFTQMVWKGTTKLGCGSNARCGMKTYVCQYSHTAGNMMGQFAQNVGRRA